MSSLFLFGVCSVRRSYRIRTKAGLCAGVTSPSPLQGRPHHSAVKETCLASLSAPPYIGRFQFGNKKCCKNSASGKKERKKEKIKYPAVLLGCPLCTSFSVLFSGPFHPPFRCGSRLASQRTPPTTGWRCRVRVKNKNKNKTRTRKMGL